MSVCSRTRLGDGILLMSPKLGQVNDFLPCPIGARIYMGFNIGEVLSPDSLHESWYS